MLGIYTCLINVLNIYLYFRLKKISVCSLSMKTNRLLLGTEGGNIYLLDINSFELQDYVIYQDVVMQRYLSITIMTKTTDKAWIGFNIAMIVL